MGADVQQPQDFPDITKLGASLLGAFVSLRFIQGTVMERSIMFVGGAAFSFYSTGPIAAWVEGRGLEGLIGFMSGLLGMTLVAKMYEVVQMLDAKKIAADVRKWVKRKWGA